MFQICNKIDILPRGSLHLAVILALFCHCSGYSKYFHLQPFSMPPPRILLSFPTRCYLFILLHLIFQQQKHELVTIHLHTCTIHVSVYTIIHMFLLHLSSLQLLILSPCLGQTNRLCCCAKCLPACLPAIIFNCPEDLLQGRLV